MIFSRSSSETLVLSKAGMRFFPFLLLGCLAFGACAHAPSKPTAAVAPTLTGDALPDRDRVRQSVIAELRAKADPAGTVWVRYNLSEVLPAPTPMTWAVVGRLLAADGGFGARNRDLGANPDPSLGSLSAFDLVAGRPMMNLARAPRMQLSDPPFEYPLAAYRADPRKALDPKPVMNPLRRGLLRGLLRLPGTGRQVSTKRRLRAITFCVHLVTFSY